MIAHKSRVNEPKSREKTQQNVRRERRRKVPRRSRLWLLMCRARATLISNKCFDRCSPQRMANGQKAAQSASRACRAPSAQRLHLRVARFLVNFFFRVVFRFEFSGLRWKASMTWRISGRLTRKEQRRRGEREESNDKSCWHKEDSGWDCLCCEKLLTGCGDLVRSCLSSSHPTNLRNPPHQASDTATT